MDNFSNNPERRKVVDVSQVNSFLAKTYGIMALAVLVSALTAFLSTTVLRSVFISLLSNAAASWVLLFLPLVLTFVISFRATRNPVASFIMLMIMAIAYGFTFAIICTAYTGATIATAFVSAATVFIAMALYGTFTKKDLANFGAYAFAALIGLIVASLVNLFLKNPMVTYIFSYIGVIIFTILTAWNAQQMKNIYANYADENTELGLAVAGALQLYLDFVNLFMYFLEIFGFNDRR
ncbi:Bax inhibitor-1/YccA family protein [Lactobacillus sp. LL6]|uniref:Bax inhibitor-1/YccA family protein n=1 Tax=unclassified Lactobacillus TaxID=2620435 RepID=UPI001186FED5|nr:Bax inhibitor-1/YccA family protein [Lactobacillus sp. LL6]TSO26725.1 Bax inhibitor-1/YccA family protein [Lactobacillus sp. LL6]